MTEGFKTFYFQPLTLWRLLDFTILRTDISSSRTKTEGYLSVFKINYYLNWDSPIKQKRPDAL